MEGTRSYGATITHVLTEAGITVVEVKPPRKNDRAGVGKTDEIDAIAATMGILSQDVDRLLQLRGKGVRSALNVLVASRHRMESQRTANRNALNTLVRELDLGIDPRTALNDQQVRQISSWREHRSDTVEQRYARAEAIRLAVSILDADKQLKANRPSMSELDEQLAPNLQSQFGFGAVAVAWILVAYSHTGRIRSEAAFSNMAGVAPLQASSGNTTRNRLNRQGDRLLNLAVDVIAKSRMHYGKDTKAYVEKRTAEGMSNREIKRILKRYITRNIFGQLQHLMGRQNQ